MRHELAHRAPSDRGRGGDRPGGALAGSMRPASKVMAVMVGLSVDAEACGGGSAVVGVTVLAVVERRCPPCRRCPAVRRSRRRPVVAVPVAVGSVGSWRP